MIDSNIRYDKFLLVNNMKNDDTKEEIKNSDSE